MLLIVLVIVNFCCGIELTGSEHVYQRNNHHNAEKHKHLPYLFHPLYLKGIGPVNARVHNPTETITITKTVVLETTKQLHKQPLCVKALPGIPYCHSKLKIQATPVLQTPVTKATKVTGVLETSTNTCHDTHLGRKVRHIILPNHLVHPDELSFRKFHTVTEILRITKIKEYADNIVTAILVAENCLPQNEDIPPCPVNMEDFEYPYKSGIQHISIIGKEEFEKRIDDGDKNFTLFSDESTIFNTSLLF